MTNVELLGVQPPFKAEGLYGLRPKFALRQGMDEWCWSAAARRRKLKERMKCSVIAGLELEAAAEAACWRLEAAVFIVDKGMLGLLLAWKLPVRIKFPAFP